MMNKFKTISALAITLMSAAVTSTPASAQVNTQVFPTSMCQPFDSRSAENLIFFSSGTLASKSSGGGFGESVRCPIPSNSIFSSFSHVVLRVKVSTVGATFKPVCSLVSYRLDPVTFFGNQVRKEEATLTTDGKTLVASLERQDYYMVNCALPPGNQMFNYSLQGVR